MRVECSELIFEYFLKNSFTPICETYKSKIFIQTYIYSNNVRNETRAALQEVH